MKFLKFIGIILVLLMGSSFAQNSILPVDPYDPIQPQNFQIQDIPASHARVVELRWAVEQSRRALMFTVDCIREDFEYSPELQSAINEQQIAYNNYVVARNCALRELYRDPRYCTYKNMSKELSVRIENNRVDSNIRGFIDLRLNYASKATQMEIDVLLTDSRFLQAKERLTIAANRTNLLRNNFNRTIRRNPDFLNAKRTFSNLTISYLSNDAYLRSAYEARNIALRHDYMTHRYDQYRYSTPRYYFNEQPYRYWHNNYNNNSFRNFQPFNGR